MIFPDVSMATIKETYATVQHLGTLVNDMQIKKDLRQHLFSTEDTEQQPIKVHTCLFRLNLTPGSMESLLFHSTLGKHADPKVFRALAVDHIITYKWDSIKYYGYVYVAYYMIYMTCITLLRYNGWRMVAVWFALHLTDECL